MRTSATGIDKSGFTTIELLVVMAILVLMSGLITISLGPSLREAKMRSATRMVIASLTYARSRAVTSGINTRVVFGSGKSVAVESHPATESKTNQVRTLTTSAGRLRSLPSGVSITTVTKRGGVKTENWVEFQSLGQSEAAMIELTDNNGSDQFVVVDAFTGRCKVKTKDELKRQATTQ